MYAKNESTLERAQSQNQDYLTTCDLVLSILAEGSRAEPVKRTELVERTGLPDRATRKIIKDLRESGYKICTTTDRGGYWIAQTDVDYRHFRDNYVSYAYEILRTVHAMDRGPITGQEEITL